MKYTRSELREKVMVILYQIDFYKRENIEYDIKNIVKENIDIENEFVNLLVFGVTQNEKELIKTIEKYLKDWNFKRLGFTDQSILKLSAFELLYTNTPNVVVINEAVELAKKYSDEKVVPLVNAILDSILDNEVKNEL